MLRASDADRERAVDILCTAAGEGRLTRAELDDRLEAALGGSDALSADSSRNLPRLGDFSFIPPYFSSITVGQLRTYRLAKLTDRMKSMTERV